MAKTTVVINNFVGGELSPRMAGRGELDIYRKSLGWSQNFIPLPQGPASYRPGTFFCGLTVGNQNAVTIPFQFSANDAIMIVATGGYFRFYRNGAAILNTAVNISGVTNANPCVVTANAHGFSNGYEIYIDGVNGPSQLNGNFYVVAGATANTFQLNDRFGAPIDSTAFSAYVSGGSAASIYALPTPYFAADLPYLRAAQIGDVMYIVCKNSEGKNAYEPRKLIRSGFTNWSLSTFARTADPFAPTASVTPTAITKANPASITVASTANLTAGMTLYASGIGGMTELNGNFYSVLAVTSGTTFTLADVNGNAINSTAYSTFTAGGNFSSADNWPGSVAFTSDGRLSYSSTKKVPQGWWASRLPSGATTRYDDFTPGGDNTFATIFQFAPVNGEVDAIEEMIQFSGNFALLGSSSILQVFGAQPGQPANPTQVNTIPTIQGAAKASPLVINWNLLFIDVDGKTLKGLQYNLAYSNYSAKDYNIGADHLGEESEFMKMAYVKLPRVEIIWLLRADGSLLSLTFNNIENIAAWSRHYFGNGGKVKDIGVIRRSGGYDELWLIVERTINGHTYMSVEVMSQWPVIPLRRKFFTGDVSTDKTRWESAAWESLKPSSYLDMAFTYEGTARGSAVGAAITLSGTTGNITATASAGVFRASDVGQQLWKKYDSTGGGGGSAVITAVTSATQASLTTLSNFDSTAVIPAGSWSFAVNRLNNLGLFNGMSVNVQADGGGHPAKTVTNSVIDLQWFASTVQVGFSYVGLLATLNIDPGSKTGSASSKSRNVPRVSARLDNTIGGFVGTNEYRMNEITFRNTAQIAGRVPPPFTGVVPLTLTDLWDASSKEIVYMQTEPAPCTIVSFEVEVDTVE